MQREDIDPAIDPAAPAEGRRSTAGRSDRDVALLYPEAPPAARYYPDLADGVRDVWLDDTLRRLWGGRKTVLRALVVALAVSVVLVLGSRKEYTSTAALLPQQLESDPLGASAGLLQQFGGLLGIGGADLLRESDNAIPVELYPDIVASLPVQLALLNRPVRVGGDGAPMSLFDYLSTAKPFSLADVPGRLLKAVLPGGSTPAPPAPADSSVVALSRRQAEVVEDLRDRVRASLDKKTGVLGLSVEMPDPQVAAQVSAATVQEMTAYVQRYRLRKLNDNLDFLEQRHREARARFNASLDALARFRDENKHLARDLARTEEQRLQAEYDLAYNVYSSLSARLEEARIKIQEETPVFQVLQPTTVPLKKSRPQTLLVLAFGLLVGLGLGAALVLARPHVRRLWTSLHA